MPDRAALVTGASSGIGLAIAHLLGERGYGLTVAARRPEKLENAAQELREKGYEVEAIPGNMADEDAIVDIVARHKERCGRLDVLVNNAGVGIGAAAGDHQTKKIDMQLDVNLRSYVIATREALPMLKETGGEHGKALIVNTSSIAGKQGQGWLSVYSATKAGVIGLSEATQKEVGDDGIQVTSLCPGFVDTPMTDWVEDQVPRDEMIRPEDIAEAVRFLLRTSKACIVPEIVFQRPAEQASVSA